MRKIVDKGIEKLYKIYGKREKKFFPPVLAFFFLSSLFTQNEMNEATKWI